MGTIIGILFVLWLIGWIGTKLGFFKEDNSETKKKNSEEDMGPLSEYEVIEVVSKMYNVEFVGPIQDINTSLKYSPFSSARKLTSRFIQNGFVAKDMYGKAVAISDTVSSIGGDSNSAFVRIGDGEYYKVAGTGDSEENMYTCCLHSLTAEYAKTLKAKDSILIIGVLRNTGFQKRELQDAILLKINDKYLPKIENYVRKMLKE